jgi:hypothetical protein
MNYEDKDLTTAIDLKTHKTVAKWPSACGQDGPHGLSLDEAAGRLFVACSTQAEVLDVGHSGEKLSSIDTGDGVDDLSYSPVTHMLYAGAARDARLTVARVDANGKLSRVATPETHQGARNGVVTKDGTVFLAHSTLGKLAAWLWCRRAGINRTTRGATHSPGIAPPSGRTNHESDDRVARRQRAGVIPMRILNTR